MLTWVLENHSWENIGEVEGSRLGAAVGGTKYKSTTLRNIPEGQSIASHCSSLPLTNIPEEEYLSETSRSMMTDRSIRSVLSDASSMALSPRLSFGKDLAKPSEVPSLELTRLDEFQTSDSDIDSESGVGTSWSFLRYRTNWILQGMPHWIYHTTRCGTKCKYIKQWKKQIYIVRVRILRI